MCGGGARDPAIREHELDDLVRADDLERRYATDRRRDACAARVGGPHRIAGAQLGDADVAAGRRDASIGGQAPQVARDRLAEPARSALERAGRGAIARLTALELDDPAVRHAAVLRVGLAC